MKGTIMRNTENKQKEFYPFLLSHIRNCAASILLLAVCGSMPLSLRAQMASAVASLDQILKDVAAYDGGSGSEALWKLRDYVYARKDDSAGRAECESKLLEFLKTPASPLAKMAVCRHLRIIGSEKAVQVLQSMLPDAAVGDAALYALQRIPGPSADKALVQTLVSSGGTSKTALIAALGERESMEAVPALASLLKQNEFTEAAAIALGNIGGAAAGSALAEAYAGAKGTLKPAVAASILRCAEKSVAAKNESAALRLYEALLSDATLPVSLRRAAMIGKISASGDLGSEVLMDQLKGPDQDMQEAAISRIADVIKVREIDSVCALAPRLPESSQIKLLAALAGYPKERVLPTIFQSGRSSSLAVRMAALRALESAGDPSAVAFLAETAAKARGPEQAAARRALGSLKGQAVNDAILAMLGQKPPDEIQEELLIAAAERRAFSARSAVASSLASTSPRLRIQALKSLRAIGTPSDIPAVLDMLIRTDQDAEQAEAEATVAALAQKIANPEGRSKIIQYRLAAEKQPAARARFIGVLPLIGDSSSLPLLRQELRDESGDVCDAAVRALASWPTSAAREDVLKLARDSKNETNRLLAIRGLVRIIGLDKYRDPEAAVADLKLAAGFARRPEEQRLILGVLEQYPCTDALNLAQGFVRDSLVSQEAQIAIDKIKARLANPQRSR
jgi:HEAT repeat protein